MKTKDHTLNEIYNLGMKALYNELGPDGMIRFLQNFESGSGDYTKKRAQSLKDYTVDSLYDEIIKNRK